MIKSWLKKLHQPIQGEQVSRDEPCRSCGSTNATLVGEVDYWDIKNSKLVKCSNCGLTQLDPMLTDKDTADGCLAYYIEESLRVSEYEQGRNLIRNYRRGFLFASHLKSLGINPSTILEMGPGSGYFTQGILRVFPKSEVTVMDVNAEVLAFNAKQHNYKTIESTLELHRPEWDGQFDLIIARDIIEHVIDIKQVLTNVHAYLRKGGHFHFITPNGHEDVWKHYVAHKMGKSPSELLINHVNYFDGKGLRDLLESLSLREVEYYTYKMKTARRGRGWKIDESQMADPSSKKDSGHFINDRMDEVREINFDKKEILNKWYIKAGGPALSLVSRMQHGNMITMNPDFNVGHEIHGLFCKE